MKKDFFCFSTKKMIILGAVITAISLLPLLILGFYNVMCYDDYIFGKVVHETWITTGNFRQTIVSAARQANSRYMGWQGCWIVTFLTGIYPANYEYTFSWLVPFLNIFLFVPAIYAVGKQLFTKWLGGAGRESKVVVIAIIFLFYQVMDSPFEGLYWYNGFTAYTFPQAFCFLGIASATRLLFENKKNKRRLWSVISAVCMVLAVSGNYITALQMMIIIAFLTVYSVCTDKSVIRYWVFPCAGGTVSFLISALAPGNMVRATTGGYTSYGAIKSILYSFYYALLYAIDWTPAIVILLWIALIPVFLKIARGSEKRFKHPLLASAGAYCILAAMYTPSLFAMGEVGMPRTNNIIQIVYYLELAAVTIYWLGWLLQRGKIPTEVSGQNEKNANRFTTVMLLVILFICCFTMNKNTYHSISAARSLVNGDARIFYNESMERYAAYLDESKEDVTVEPYSSVPALFNLTDLSTDPQNWLNCAVADYFGKKSVMMQEAGE